MDHERSKREEALRREAAERPATDPRVDAVGYGADDPLAEPMVRRAGTTHGGVGAEEEARLEEGVRRGARRAIEEKEQEASGGGGLSGSQIDQSHIIVAAIGHVSGAHVNPAVTLGMAATKKFPWQFVPHYIGAQLVGAVLGALATWITFGGPARGEAKLAATYPAQGVGDLQAFVVEILITFILVFVVMAVATDDRAPAAIAPIAVGFALAVGVFIAGPVTGGSVNPARTLGPMLVAGDLTSVWLYILGPIIGGILGALLYDRTIAQTQGPA